MCGQSEIDFWFTSTCTKIVIILWIGSMMRVDEDLLSRDAKSCGHLHNCSTDPDVIGTYL